MMIRNTRAHQRQVSNLKKKTDIEKIDFVRRFRFSSKQTQTTTDAEFSRNVFSEITLRSYIHTLLHMDI